MAHLPQPNAEPMKLVSLAEVARGGMGSVELARVVEGKLEGQVLAIKRLHPNIAEDPEFVSMFLDEAWMTAALKHPNVVQVVAWGEDERGRFLAIELVQGVSLARLLKESRQNQEPFAERSVAFICSQICAGLTAAHSLAAPDGTPMGLVHRDLTPANVLVSFDGMVKIIDFGIAKAEERISHTRTGQLKGKPSYMAPEQQRGGAVDARTDLFSFGVLMFELLAGRRPWTAKGAFDVMMEIANDPHPDLGQVRRGLNPEFVAIAHGCLQKKPGDRFGSAAEIKARLDGWLASRGFTADDRTSLANFVVRNSAPQIKWWHDALRGDFQKKAAPTFKELEEKIDEDREKAKGKAGARGTAPMPIRPAAGALPVHPAAAAFPVRPGAGAIGPSTSPTPLPGSVPTSSNREPLPSSQQPAMFTGPSGAPPANRPPSGASYPATQPGSSSLSVPRISTLPPTSDRRVGSSGPEFLTPFPPSGSPRPQTDHPGATFAANAALGTRPSVHPPAAPSTLATTLPGAQASIATQRPAEKRSRVPLLVLLVLITLIGAGVYAFLRWGPGGSIFTRPPTMGAGTPR